MKSESAIKQILFILFSIVGKMNEIKIRFGGGPRFNKRQSFLF